MMTKAASPKRDPLEQAVLQRLLELGIISEIRPLLAPDAIPEDRQLITVEGKPISERIIEERR